MTFKDLVGALKLGLNCYSPHWDAFGFSLVENKNATRGGENKNSIGGGE